MKTLEICLELLIVLCVLRPAIASDYQQAKSSAVFESAVTSPNDLLSVPFLPELQPKLSPINRFPGELPAFGRDVEKYDPANPRHLLDKSATESGREIGGLGPCKSFSGTMYTGWDPPDPQIAVGPSQIVEVVNSVISVFDKSTGTLLLQTTAQNWFLTTQPAPPSSYIYGPRVVYDPVAGRFVLLFLSTDSVNKSAFLVSVSQSSNAMGAWWSYCLDATLNGSTPSSTWPDFPGLAFDYDEAIYLSANMWLFSGTFTYAKVRILPKNRIYGGLSVSFTDLWDIKYHNATRAFAVKPAIMLSDADGEYLLSNLWSGGTYTTYWKITNPLNSPLLTIKSRVNIAAYSFPPFAPQMGGSSIGMAGAMTQDVVYRNGRVYTAFDQAFDWGSSTVAAIRLLGIDTLTSQATTDLVIGGPGKSYFQPTVHVNAANRLFITFSRSAPDEYPGSWYIEDLASDVRAKPLKSGEGPRGGSEPVRWGDHCGIAGDPSDAARVWMCGEYNTSAPFHWGTWIGYLPSRVASPALNIPVVGSSQKAPVLVSWDPTLPADSYQLQLDNDSNFSSLLVNTVVDTNRYLTSGLTAGTKYFWRVKAITPCPDNQWSGAFSFVACNRLPGDVDGNGIVTISDAVYVITYVFASGPAPSPLNAGDSDCNSIVNISDAVRLIGYIFAGGIPPCGPC